MFIGFHVNRVALGVQRLDMALLSIAREVFGNQVHQAFDTDLVNGRAAVYRTDITAADTDPQALGDLMNVEFLFHEELFHQLFVSHGNRFGDFHVVFFDLVSQIRRDFLRFIAVVKVPCFLPQDIDGTDRLAVLDNRHFERDNALAELITDICQNIIKVGIRIVHLVDEEDGRQLALAYSFLPGSLGACFDAFLGINNDQGIVTNAEAGDFFAFIVHVAGGVDEVDLLAFPFDRGQMAVAGQAALAFFRVKVQGGCAVGVCAESINCLGEIQAGFDHRALAGPGVSQDNNISYFICQIVFHFAVLPLSQNILQVREAFLADIVDCHVAVKVCLILSGAVLKQELDQARITDIGRPHQGCAAASVNRVDICAMVDQDLDDVFLVCVDRFHQGCTAVFVSCVDIRTLADEILNNLSFAQQGSSHHGRTALIVMRIDIRAGMFQHTADFQVSLFGSPHQSCLIVLVPGPRVSPVVQQETYDVHIAALGTAHQCCPAVTIRDVDVRAFGNHRANLLEVSSCCCIEEFLINLIHKNLLPF